MKIKTETTYMQMIMKYELWTNFKYTNLFRANSYGAGPPAGSSPLPLLSHNRIFAFQFSDLVRDCDWSLFVLVITCKCCPIKEFNSCILDSCTCTGYWRTQNSRTCFLPLTLLFALHIWTIEGSECSYTINTQSHSSFLNEKEMKTYKPEIKIIIRSYFFNVAFIT